MKRWHRAVALAVALVLINAATQLVIRANLSAGLYPAEADSIGIPIMTTLYLSLALIPWLGIAGALGFAGAWTPAPSPDPSPNAGAGGTMAAARRRIQNRFRFSINISPSKQV